MRWLRMSAVLSPLIAGLIGAGALGAQAATGVVTGRVVDSASQAPVAAARVTVVGGNQAVRTGAGGQYTITGVPIGPQRIRVTRLGFAPGEETVQVTGGQTVQRDFVLLTQAISLETVVAVGYGTQRARAVSGAVTTVTADQLNPIASTSVNQMLEGKAPGLNLVTRSAQPGGGVSVNIRGAISPQGNSTPLYVIDGVPISEYRSSVPGLIDTDLGFYGGVDRDPLAYLNPDDIEAITVLKDASAAAIYGSAAANGVVLITTKSGKAGSMRVVYRTSFGELRIEAWVVCARALPFVNQVRTRAGVPTWSGLSQAELRDSLLAERGRELYAEGVRRDDLIRAGKFISSALARGAAAKPGNVLFPIPLEVIQQSNGIITQNPGY